MNNLLVTT